MINIYLKLIEILSENFLRTIAFFQKRTAKITAYKFIANFFANIFLFILKYLTANILKPLPALVLTLIIFLKNNFNLIHH
jgi:hypothetical protein